MIVPKKALFFTVWLLVLLIGPFTILKTTPYSVAVSNQALLINYIQRFVGLTAFTLLFYQIVSGAFMKGWTRIFGAWLFRFHLFEGAMAYALVLFHPVLYILFNFKLRGSLDPFYVFTEVCALCSSSYELYLSFGRLAFWLVSVAVISAKFRAIYALRTNWRKFHILNYAAFFLVAFHSFNVGSDVQAKPFSYFFYFALATVSGIIAYKLFRLIRPKAAI